MTQDIITDVALFCPEKPPWFFLDFTTIRKLPFWKRQVIALFVHEFVHMLQFVFVYKCDKKKWYMLRTPALEFLPIMVQNIITWLLISNYRKSALGDHLLHFWQQETYWRSITHKSDFKKSVEASIVK